MIYWFCFGFKQFKKTSAEQRKKKSECENKCRALLWIIERGFMLHESKIGPAG